MKAKVIIHRNDHAFCEMIEVASKPDQDDNYGALRNRAGMYGQDEVLYVKRVYGKPHKFEARA
jgi:hypothetical protein